MAQQNRAQRNAKRRKCTVSWSYVGHLGITVFQTICCNWRGIFLENGLERKLYAHIRELRLEHALCSTALFALFFLEFLENMS